MEQIHLVKSNIPILTAIKKIETGKVELIDIYGESIGEEYTIEDIYNFVNNNISIFDSRCGLMKYSMFPELTKPTKEQLSEFLNYKK